MATECTEIFCGCHVARNHGLPATAVTLAFLVAACASAPPVVEELEPEAPAGPEIVQPGDGYLMYYVDGTDIHVRATVAGVDSVIVSGASDVWASVSPGGDRVAVAYAHGDSARLVVIEASSGAIARVHAGPAGEYTMAWSADAAELGAGLRPASADERGAVIIADTNDNVRNVGCSVSNRFVAWRANGQAIVGDAANIYAVDVQDCRTLATLPRRNKTNITYSPDGNLVFFERDAGLIGARYNGANTQWVARARHQPRNARWSPDGRRIAFEVQSPRFSNVRHLALYEYATGRMTVRDEEKPLGVPRDLNPCWSPGGDRIAHDREYFRSGDGQEYVQRQKIVMSVSSGAEVVVAEELVRDGEPPETGCRWIDDNHIALSFGSGAPRIFNIETKVAYRLPDNSRLLYAKVVRR